MNLEVEVLEIQEIEIIKYSDLAVLSSLPQSCRIVENHDPFRGLEKLKPRAPERLGARPASDLEPSAPARGVRSASPFKGKAVQSCHIRQHRVTGQRGEVSTITGASEHPGLVETNFNPCFDHRRIRFTFTRANRAWGLCMKRGAKWDCKLREGSDRLTR
jgi:hypothetical protein